MTTNLLPYKVLVVDDNKGPTSWGETTKVLLESYEFQVSHVYTADEARDAIRKTAFDIFVIDLDLQSRETGVDLQRDLRTRGLRQPIILVSGNIDFLSAPISDYANALAMGPVTFYDKRSDVDLVDIVREASNRVDPIRRSFRLMSEAGLGETQFEVEGRKYSIDELLASSLSADGLVRTLREALYALVLEAQSLSVGQTNESQSG